MKTVLITGARSGIAAALIDKLKMKDYYIYATTETEKQAYCLEEKYKNFDNIKVFKLDITNINDRSMIDSLDIDILVCNAAICDGGSLASIDVDKVRENYEVNVFSNLELIQEYLKKIINKNGKIIIMSSLSGIVPINFIGSYSSTKASLIKVAQTLKNELRLINKNIKICLIEPGMYRTGFNQYMFENKYDNYDIYFNSVIDVIRKKESLMINYICRKNLTSIVNKIYGAIKCDDPKFIYRAPFFQVLGAKIYMMFKW